MSDEMQILDIGGLEGPLGQRVYTALRDGILDMSLHPGMVLRKGALCEQLGVSRSPVAEALGRLSSEGLVDVIPQSATRVSQLFLADLLEECFLREAVEVAAVTKVTLERTDEQLTKLTRNLRLQGLLVDDKDFQGFFEADVGFHELILGFTGFPKVVAAAGVSGLIYASNFLKSNPGKRAAVVAVESPTATFQLEDHSMANMVSAAIFGDGAACVLLSSEDAAIGPKIVGEEMYHFPDATQMMGFDLTNHGLKMILDPQVPATIAEHFPKIVHPFLEKNGTTIENVDHLIFHPGGKKIVQTVEELFGSLGKNIDDTREVLRLFGNMSSATVLYVLERFLEKDIKAGAQGLVLSFGPGFSAQRVLLEW